MRAYMRNRCKLVFCVCGAILFSAKIFAMPLKNETEERSSRGIALKSSTFSASAAPVVDGVRLMRGLSQPLLARSGVKFFAPSETEWWPQQQFLIKECLELFKKSGCDSADIISRIQNYKPGPLTLLKRAFVLLLHTCVDEVEGEGAHLLTTTNVSCLMNALFLSHIVMILTEMHKMGILSQTNFDVLCQHTPLGLLQDRLQALYLLSGIGMLNKKWFQKLLSLDSSGLQDYCSIEVLRKKQLVFITEHACFTTCENLVHECAKSDDLLCLVAIIMQEGRSNAITPLMETIHEISRDVLKEKFIKNMNIILKHMQYFDLIVSDFDKVWHIIYTHDRPLIKIEYLSIQMELLAQGRAPFTIMKRHAMKDQMQKILSEDKGVTFVGRGFNLAASS